MISILALLLCLTLLPDAAQAGWFSNDTLLTIDGKEHTVEDFKRWWQFWQEKDQPLPENPDFYIDWLLLKEEAERMDLANAPGFKRKERIFLQSRGLLMLKNEAVDSQIKVTDEQIEARYQEKYLPRWLVQRLQFVDEEAALKAWQELSDGKVTVASLLERSVEEGGPEGSGESWLRPKGTDPGWVAILQSKSVGEVVDPELHKKGSALYYMKDRADGSEEDLGTVRGEISKTLWREQEDQLTAKLLKDLTEKYQMKIDEERLAAIDLTAEDSTFSDELVITSSKENVSEKQFVAVVRKLAKSRPAAMMAMTDEKLAQKFKLETANNIIHQSVTNWWTLDRHFEKEEPFKWSYQFNYNYRLVSMLEQQLFQVKVKPTEEELAQLYQEKAKFYIVPAQAKLYIVDETQGPIDKIWAEVAVGKPFKQVAREYLGRSVRPVEAPLNHLDPQVKGVVAKLAEGETSQIFKAQEARVLVHLVSRTSEQPMPLEKIKDSLLSGFIRESFDKARRAYLETLKSSTRIEVDEGNWKSIQKELGGA
jgi:hypothetical protein